MTNIESKIFQRKKPDFSKLKAYGMVRGDGVYHYETDFMNGDFRALIDIDETGRVVGSVIDTMNGEEYAQLRNPLFTGAFVGSVRGAYEDILCDIADECFDDVLFSSMQANRIAARILAKYGDAPDFPWKQEAYKACGVFRHQDTSKWYGLIMNVRESVLDKSSSDAVLDAINLKADEKDIENLQKSKGIYPAYHMSRKYWITVALDDTFSDDRIMELIDVSYRLTDKKHNRCAK